MARVLQSSGLALELLACVAVDDDGSTITDFVSGNTVSLDSGVAASVATGSWKSIASPKYFVTTANGAFDFFGVRWTGTLPNVDENDSDGCAAWFACEGASNCSQFGRSFINIAATSGNAEGLSRVSDATATGLFWPGGGTQATSATNLPTNGTTKFSFGANYRNNDSSEVFYGLESGSLASDGTAGADGGFGSATAKVRALGGDIAQGHQAYKPYIACVFKKKLTLTEMQSLHDDWLGALFVGGGIGPMFRGG